MPQTLLKDINIRNTSKPVFIWAVIFCLLLPGILHFTYKMVREKSIKRTVKALVLKGIPEEKLVHLTLSLEEADYRIDWKEYNEFEYQGEMFDVVRMVEKGDSIHYYCWHDKDETQLKSQWRKLIRDCIDVDPIRKQNKKRKADFENTLICLHHPFLGDYTLSLLQKTSHYFIYIHFTGFTQLHTPPPRRTYVS